MSLKMLLFCLFGLSILPQQAGAQGDLTRFRDKNRLLLVFAPNAADPRWRRQNQLLVGSRAEFIERELLRFDVFERGADAARLRARYHVRAGIFRALLIGKDGHVAQEWPRPVAAHEMIGLIDQMPMRRDEMRRRHHENSRQKENS